MGFWFTGRGAAGAGNGAPGGGLPPGLDEQTLRFNAALNLWLANSILANDGVNLFSQNLMKFGTVGTPPTHNVHAEGTSPGFFVRTSADVATRRTPISQMHRTSANMANGFGNLLQFFIEDDTSGIVGAGDISTVRNGADNTSDMQLAPRNVGAERITVKMFADTGSVVLGDTVIVPVLAGSPYADFYTLRQSGFDISIAPPAILTGGNVGILPDATGIFGLMNAAVVAGDMLEFDGLNLIPRTNTVRLIASGSNVIAAATTVVVSTVIRNATERLRPPDIFVTNNVAGIGMTNLVNNNLAAFAASDNIIAWYERTAVANIFNLSIHNNDAVNARTVEWAIEGFVP